MADIKIKGYSGAWLPYSNVPKIWLAAPESTEEDPVLVPFTPGELLEGVEVEPDFSAGDMTVTVPEGYLVRSAVVKKPETLVPENIAEGVDVAGIIGTLAGGGSAKIAGGTYSYSASSQAISHNLGMVPDLIVVCSINSIASGYEANSTPRTLSLWGISANLKSVLGFTYGGGYTKYNNSKWTVYQSSAPFESMNNTSYINSVGTQKFTIPGTVAGGLWLAIGGLT